MKNRKAKRNKYAQAVQAELDLHGLTKEEARKETLDFLSEAINKGYGKIRIITGKGIHSQDNQGVLKEYIQFILTKEGLKHCDSKISEGGSGAIDVKL